MNCATGTFSEINDLDFWLDFCLVCLIMVNLVLVIQRVV